jgi:hypothetical protein
MPERFTETLRAASEAGWSHAVQHRFVNELIAGAVPDAVMARYLIQDHRFLDSFLVLLGAALTSADTFAARPEQFEQWRYSGGGHRLKSLVDWREWQEFLAGAPASAAGVRRSKNGVVQQALRIVWKAYTKRRWGLPGRTYREAAERLTAAGYPTKEQSFKDTLRDRKPPPENTIPTDAPGVRDLVLALLDLWPSFEWERLVRDAPAGWIDEDLTQNDGARQVERPVTIWDHEKVALPDTTHRVTECNLQLPPAPQDASIVPLRPVLKPKFAAPRIA